MVYPVIAENEESELKAAIKMYRELSGKIFADLKVGLLHGRLEPELKDQVMRMFQKGELQILVATTVIEVGVDVPNATVMVIEHAERFGLAQLHQLRGRIGRGAAKSYCVLMTGGKVTEEGESGSTPWCGPTTASRLPNSISNCAGRENFLALGRPGCRLSRRQPIRDRNCWSLPSAKPRR